jgi:hypothetical protein
MRKVKAHARGRQQEARPYIFLYLFLGTTLHNMIVEGVSMPAALKKNQADPRAEELAADRRHFGIRSIL